MTPIEISSRFETQARADFENRVAEASAGYLRLASDAATSALVEAICAMDGRDRYGMFRAVMADTSGPVTLEGMEGLVGFVSGLVRGAPAYAVVSEPDDPETDPTFGLCLAAARSDAKGTTAEETVKATALEAYASRERRMVILPARERPDGLAAGIAEVMKAIDFNAGFDGRFAGDGVATSAARLSVFRGGNRQHVGSAS